MNVVKSDIFVTIRLAEEFFNLNPPSMTMILTRRKTGQQNNVQLIFPSEEKRDKWKCLLCEAMFVIFNCIVKPVT